MRRRIEVLLGLVLCFAATISGAEPVRYTFTIEDAITVDPLLTELTSVSGSFVYEEDMPLVSTDAASGNSVYVPLSALSGTANGNGFSALLGAAIVGNDTFQSGMLINTDFFMLVASSNGLLNGFSLNDMDLRSVRFFWIEGQDDIEDFLDDQSLPTTLPPATAGKLALDFVGADEITHTAFFEVAIAADGAADTYSIEWSGPMSYVELDTGGAVFSSVSTGTTFDLEIDLTTALGTITDGATTARFTVDASTGNLLQFTDNLVVEAEDVAWVNAVAGTSFVAGDVVDIVEFEGSALTAAGGTIDVGVVDVLDAETYSGVGPSGYPPEPISVLTRVFWIDETDGAGNDIYSGGGTIGQIDPAGTFNDVPLDFWAFSFVERLAASGVTRGCGNSNYCPNDQVTRAQMAVFLERGMNGSDFSPPAATGNLFLDVGASDFAAAFIEQLSADGITSGCGSNNYCPADSVTRAQMAVFLLRAMHGGGYSPPPPTGMFGDVDLSHWAVSWIEQLAAEGITSGCGGGNYCPNDPVTRAQMAVFLVRAFDL